MKLIDFIFELVGLGGLVLVISYITWTKMLLGSVITLVGAFFPEMRSKEKQHGEGEINAGNFRVVFSGGLRFAVVIAGIILIIGSVVDGFQGAAKENITSTYEQKLSADSMRKIAEALEQSGALDKKQNDTKIDNENLRKLLELVEENRKLREADEKRE